MTERITEYFIATGITPEELAGEVDRHINENGAQPFGSLVITQFDDPEGGFWRHYLQPMVSYEKVE